MFAFRARNKTIKELRKNQGLTVQELALKARLESIQVLKIDDLKLKDVPDSIRHKILPYINGSVFDRIPWL